MDRKDHPRSRGVYTSATICPRRPEGSSPLARGLLILRLPTGSLSRIIPARAGFTAVRLVQGKARTDHPRSRGVYGHVPRVPGDEVGSSPLARGLQSSSGPVYRPIGIIPARAGFTCYGGRDSPSRKDHPRSRGVYVLGRLRRRKVGGSSPLARGLLDAVDAVLPGPGIIPARAGFTRRQGSQGPERPDHPRSRGVYRIRGNEDDVVLGSSPLARGLQPTAPGGGLSPGIIPARAGFTAGHARRRLRPEDHPRSRGVYRKAAGTYQATAGSSPLARGLRRRG